jgi:hypothetical protein
MRRPAGRHSTSDDDFGSLLPNAVARVDDTVAESVLVDEREIGSAR